VAGGGGDLLLCPGLPLLQQIYRGEILALDGLRATPAERLENGRDFLVTNKWVVFGHHFAAIAGRGRWWGRFWRRNLDIFRGRCGCWRARCLRVVCRTFVILLFSVRRDGKSLTEMAKDEIGIVGDSSLMWQ